MVRKPILACCLIAATICLSAVSVWAEAALSPQARDYLKMRQSLGAMRPTETDLTAQRSVWRGKNLELIGQVIGRTNSQVATAARPITFMLQLPATRQVVMVDAREDWPLICVDRVIHVLVSLSDDARPGDHFLLQSLIAESDLPAEEQRFEAAVAYAAFQAKPQFIAASQTNPNDTDKPEVAGDDTPTPAAPTPARPTKLPSRPGTVLPPASAATGAAIGDRTVDVWKQWVRSINPKLADAEADLIARCVIYYSALFGVDRRLAFAMIKCESDFDPRCFSHSGAMGLTQLMPGTAKGVGCGNPWDSEQNIRGGIRYLSYQLKAYASRSNYDQFSLALASYNAGPNAVKRAGGIPNIPETQRYVKKVGDLFYQLYKSGMP